MSAPTVKGLVRRRVSRRSVLRLAGGAAATAVGFQLLGTREALGAFGVLHIHRAVVLISLSQEKIKTLANEKRLRPQILRMARALGSQRGVRHVEAVEFVEWKPDPKDPKEPKEAPWRPFGALLFVEALDERTLNQYIDIIMRRAADFDQTLMRLNPMDSF